MIKVTTKNKLFFIGKLDEILEAIDYMIITHGKDATLLEVIEHYLEA